MQLLSRHSCRCVDARRTTAAVYVFVQAVARFVAEGGENSASPTSIKKQREVTGPVAFARSAPGTNRG